MDLQKFQSNNYHLLFTYGYRANGAFNLLKMESARDKIESFLQKITLLIFKKI